MPYRWIFTFFLLGRKCAESQFSEPSDKRNLPELLTHRTRGGAKAVQIRFMGHSTLFPTAGRQHGVYLVSQSPKQRIPVEDLFYLKFLLKCKLK